MSINDCMRELSEIISNKENSASERMKAMGILIDLKNSQSENKNSASDNSVNVTIDYGENNEH